jgi:hypothetical protein
MDFASEKGERTVTFDGKAGRVGSVIETYTMTGVVHSMVGPGELNARMTRTHAIQITVTDEKPKAKK